jgi:hypothetical protein
MATKQKISAAALATKIDDGSTGMQVEEGGGFGRSLYQGLLSKGWVHAESYSECSKASFEAHLKKGNRRVEIISASFLGVFTDIRCFTVDDD